jgi:curli biogenesis system outer membrane secretion channel CsgG
MNIKIKNMRKFFLIVFTATLTLGITGAKAQSGYIIKVDGDKVYMNLPNVKVSDIVSVLDSGSSIRDPRTGREIWREPEVVGQIKIIAVQGAYSVGKVYGNTSINPQEGMTVSKGTVIQKNDYGETTVMIAPVELNFPQGLNTMVGDGYIGDYVTAALMEQLLKSDKIQVLDRSILQTQRNELNMAGSGEIDYNTALQYGKMMGARYIIKVTMQKPDVVTVGSNIPLRGIIQSFNSGRQSNNTGNRQSRPAQQLQQLIPENISTVKVQVAVNITAHIIDLQTGVVLFMSKGMGVAAGMPQLSLEIAAVGRTDINQGADFSQTVTGIAIEDAFGKIGRELNNYFDKQIKR